jgi:hypothetical protein
MNQPTQKDFFIPKFLFWDIENKCWMEEDITGIYSKNANSTTLYSFGDNKLMDMAIHGYENGRIIAIPSLGIPDEAGQDIYAHHYMTDEKYIYRFIWAHEECRYRIILCDFQFYPYPDSIKNINDFYDYENNRLRLRIVGNQFETDIDDLINGE